MPDPHDSPLPAGHRPQIVVTGSLAFDHIMDFPGSFKDHILPDKLHLINVSFLVERLEKQRGGCAGNIAYTLALLGEEPRIVAAAGGDFDGYRDWLEEYGIDVEAIHTFEDEITASCFITTDRSDSQITGFYPGAMRRAREISLARSAGVRAAAVIVAPDDPEAMVRHCREAREAGIPLFFDPSFQVTAMDGATLREATQGCEALLVNDYEHAVFLDKTELSPEELSERARLVVVTLGKEGSRIRVAGEEEIRVPPAEAAQVVDPTGAGDAFRAGFLAGWIRRWPLGVCGRMGSVAAAYAIECYGTQSHSYDPEEFAARYQRSFGEPLPG